MTNETNHLKQRWGIPGSLEFSVGNGGLTKASLRSNSASAEIYLYGGHITSFKPDNTSEVLWMSSQSLFQEGKAIRGGIPLIWPWFGAHPTDTTKPQHGFMRTSFFTVIGSGTSSKGSVIIALRPSGDNSSNVHLYVELGDSLVTSFSWTNTSSEPQTYSSALHSYFTVSEASTIMIPGVNGLRYIDKVAGGEERLQSTPLCIEGEIDRIYQDPSENITILDGGLNRKIHIHKTGSLSSVVWNPGAEKACAMGDFPDDGYRTMVCVEVANAAWDARTLEPGNDHHIRQEISVEVG
jgi:glucose-6-phosphate 1-epimerase